MSANIVFQLYLAKTGPRISRAVSLRQLIFLFYLWLRVLNVAWVWKYWPVDRTKSCESDNRSLFAVALLNQRLVTELAFSWIPFCHLLSRTLSIKYFLLTFDHALYFPHSLPVTAVQTLMKSPRFERDGRLDVFTNFSVCNVTANTRYCNGSMKNSFRIKNETTIPNWKDYQILFYFFRCNT